MRDAGERERKKEEEKIFFKFNKILLLFFSFLLQCATIYVLVKLNFFSYGSTIITCIFVFW